LSYLRDPRILRQHAISSFPQGPQRDWASGVIDNYEGDVKARFPAITMDDSLKEIAEIRNLLHGVQATGGPHQEAEGSVQDQRASPNLQLINEVAAFW